MDDLPLGQRVDWPAAYDASVLRAIERAPARAEIGIADAVALPFVGEDLWRGYELSWLKPTGVPCNGVLTMRVPAESPAMVESKSLKLYLNSFAQTAFDSGDDVAAVIGADMSALLGATVRAAVLPATRGELADFGHYCLDELTVAIKDYLPNPDLLRPAAGQGADAVHTHLFRSVCPVTGQPDWGSIALSWRGRLLRRESLLAYLVSFRQHASFHENVVERIFVEVGQATAASELTVDARFLRRGGIDINPFRSTRAAAAPSIRLHRQ